MSRLKPTDPLNEFRKGYAERMAKIAALRSDESSEADMVARLRQDLIWWTDRLEKTRASLVEMGQTVELPL